MEHSSIPAPARFSALPRPQSKLPQLRPPSSAGRPLSPELKSPIRSIGRPTIPQPRAAPPPPSSHRQSFLPPARTQTSDRLPLRPSSRPQSRHDSAVSSFEQEYHAHRKVRQPSQQENTYDLMNSPGESDGSTSPLESATSPIRPVKRGPRPSLSDRTMESISSIPPSPAARRSSFFNPTSPMSPRTSRPPSALGQNQVSKLNFAPRDGSFIRPPSPHKRPTSAIGGPKMAPRRSISAALPTSSLPAPGSTSPHKRASSTIKPTVRPPSAADRPVASNGRATGRPMSMQVPTTTMSSLNARLATSTRTTPTPRPAIANQSKVRRPIEKKAAEPETQDKSSANLRAQIAKARALHKQGNTPPVKKTYSFEDCADPFNQGKSDNPMQRRIDAARKDGRLNIAAMDLKQIPDEVLQMYDSAAMESSSVPWNETVDLVRFIAADNVIESVADDVFPDKSIEELAAGMDARGNQFGGLEHLDLHGNILKQLPMGLWRLENLAVLNLSRNKLDNGIFDIVQRMEGLRELYLNDNELARDVPESIGQMANLEVLHLQNNKLTALPGSVRNLINLRIVNVSSNRFAELPIGPLFSLPGLREVYVASNALTGAFFPMTVDTVRTLQTLDLSNNSLASISFGSELYLPAIQFLNISRNRFFGLPSVSSWTKLTTLLAEENALTALPEGFTQLRNLKVADFKRNNLRSVEPEVARMDALDTFDVAANPLRDKKLLTMGAHDIKEEMRKRLEAAAEA